MVAKETSNSSKNDMHNKSARARYNPTIIAHEAHNTLFPRCGQYLTHTLRGWRSVCASCFIACLQAVCGCLYRGKAPENAEFPIAAVILDARENRSGVTRQQTACKQATCFIVVCLLFLSTPIHKSADDFSSTYAVGGLP